MISSLPKQIQICDFLANIFIPWWTIYYEHLIIGLSLFIVNCAVFETVVLLWNKLLLLEVNATFVHLWSWSKMWYSYYLRYYCRRTGTKMGEYCRRIFTRNAFDDMWNLFSVFSRNSCLQKCCGKQVVCTHWFRLPHTNWLMCNSHHNFRTC